LHGAIGNDTLEGGIGQDTLFGGWRDDVIPGIVYDPNTQDLDGKDYLNGGGGNDLIIAGKKLEKEVIPCDEYMQAFAYTHLLPAEELRLGSFGRGDGNNRKGRKK